jgi:hypothetical protein
MTVNGPKPEAPDFVAELPFNAETAISLSLPQVGEMHDTQVDTNAT